MLPGGAVYIGLAYVIRVNVTAFRLWIRRPLLVVFEW